MKLFAIFGDPIAHSRSPLMHNSVFKNLQYNACYTRIHLLDGSKLREIFFALQLSGANITVPHKEEAYKACDEVRGFAKKVGVVNTIVNEDGKLIGYNTDADGFIYAVSEFKNIQKVLILGAGGTAKALSAKFSELSWDVSVLNRSENRLDYFKSFGSKCFTWDNFEVSEYDLIVNTTSAGLKDDNLPAPEQIIESILDHTRYVADAIYGKVTPFLQAAQNKGLVSKDGAAMLLGQGVLANALMTRNALEKEDIHRFMQESFLY